MSILNFPLSRVFFPPSLVLKQFGSVLYFKHLIKWNNFNKWFLKHSIPSLPVAAGAYGMGCIGFPAHPVFEITAKCNLRCIHCHVSGGKAVENELSTEEAKRVLDEMRECDEFRMIAFTGGEPFVREDLFELLEYSHKIGFMNVIATNATLIDDKVAKKLKKVGVVGLAISLDSTIEEIHNKIRANKDAFELAMRGIRATRKAGILLQINTTAMGYNFDNLREMINLSEELGSGIMLMYQLVPVGRGNIIEKASLKVNENEKLIKFLSEEQKNISTIVEPVAGPQYWAYLLEREGKTNKIWLKMAEQVFHGCTAGRGFVYIKANGEVWPCPFVEVNAGNVRYQHFKDIWENSAVFLNLRNREKMLKGNCGGCKYSTICGGCRGRAMAYYGDYLAEDSSCFLTHKRDLKRD